MKYAIFSALLLFLNVVLRAELVWEKTEIEKEIPAGAEILEASFRFKNTGKEEITVKSVNSNCGCTTAELEKREYKEGESGEIKVVFEIGERVGFQEKNISVMTDEKSNGSYVLTLKTNVPEILKMEQRLVVWKEDEAMVEKTVKLELNRTLPDVNVKAECRESKLAVVLSEPDENGVYLLKLKPQQTKEPIRATIRLVVSWGEGKKRTFSVYTRIG